MVPKPLIYIGIVVAVLALIPPAIIAQSRATTRSVPRIHFVQDMDNQHRFKAQQVNVLFEDGRAMRPVVPGTVARGELNDDDQYERGLIGDAWATTYPARVDVDLAFVRRGQERFNIYCSVCHGEAGYGDGIVHQRAMQLLSTPGMSNGTSWVAPKSLHEELIREQPLGQTYNTITNGVRNMSGYAAQIPVEDRWAIVAYVKALQRSQRARPTDVPDVNLLPEETIIMQLEEEGS